MCVALVAMVAACAGRGGPSQSTAQYATRAQDSYDPPGPAHDPWGPYIEQASRRFDVPERWIREVMRQESGGRTHFSDGRPITSPAGAMGLMQVMPGTFEEIRAQYPDDVGSDPYHPRDSLMAGTAYIRMMYDLYGSPAFLVAYNAGPRRLEDYLNRGRGLPDETRNYVARIGPNIVDSHPERRVSDEVYAANDIPLSIPRGPRFGTRFAARGGRAATEVARAPIRQPAVVARAARPSREEPRQPVFAAATIPDAPRRGFSLIPPAAAAAPAAPRGGPATWAIQVGAYTSESQARAALGEARGRAPGALGGARPAVASVQSGRQRLHRARYGGLTRESALAACQAMGTRTGCTVLSPDAQ